MTPAGRRPAVDERIDAVLARRLTPAQHRGFWYAESIALGGTTPYEAWLAGRREAVLELAMGRPGAEPGTRLISAEEGRGIRERHGDRSPPHEL